MKPAELILIEDNPGDLYLVQMALRENHIAYRMTHFESGSDAVHSLCRDESQTPRPDLILMDLNTPRTDGFEALRELRQARSLHDVPIAILTSSRAVHDRRRVELKGARYIEKPSSLDAFLTIVGGSIKELLTQPATSQPAST